MSAYAFDRAPRPVYWELTRACDLACRHCRAMAIPERERDETRLRPRAGLHRLGVLGGRAGR